jgi:hypothetical protein
VANGRVVSNTPGASMDHKAIKASEAPSIREGTMRIASAIAISALLLFSTNAQAQIARQELHAFQSVTMSDTDFLRARRTVPRSLLRRTCDFQRWVLKSFQP